MTEAQIRRSRTTLLDQFSAMEHNNLQDLLKERDEDDASGAGTGSQSTGIATLASILESEKQGGRTLLDIIQEEDDARGDTPELGSGGGTTVEVENESAVRVSLMSLLAMTDGTVDNTVVTASSGVGVAMVSVAEDEEEEEAAPVTVVDERMLCCVCTTRKKGAAFIPCGHTFCRACSRELRTGRGSCPLCNGLILDILDIF